MPVEEHPASYLRAAASFLNVKLAKYNSQLRDRYIHYLTTLSKYLARRNAGPIGSASAVNDRRS